VDAVTGRTPLVRARAGDGDAFRELVGPYRRELQVHCYRILGSVPDAEDVLQETLLAAWRGLDRFEERASVRAWLYRIATNRSLNVLRDNGRRPAAAGPGAAGPGAVRAGDPAWAEPYPDALLEDLPDTAPGPEARYETRESLGLAFVAGLQRLPPRQRAALVLRDVLGFRAAEVADMLDSTETSVNSALQRARVTLDSQLPRRDAERPPLPRSARERELAGRFADAFENADIDGVVALLTDDASLTMPPEPLEVRGPAAIAAFFRQRIWRGEQRVRLRPTRANGQPAFGYYLRDPGSPVAHAHGLIVLTLAGDRIGAITRFGGGDLFPLFGLPPTLHE
jgi:RNA polymerase sigma-70 factor (ECF subfamily)